MLRRIALALAFFAASSVAVQAAGVRLVETGSTLLYPVMKVWADSYAQVADVQIATAPSGSGTGIAEATAGNANLGASDAYLTDAQMKAGLLNIPLAISGQFIAYNVPELGAEHLNLNGPVLAAIYSGTITSWDDAKIKEINRELAGKLPKKTIVPIRRTEKSGDTFLFTQYLSMTTPSWEKGPGFGTYIAWPAVGGMQAARGNAGMAQLVADIPYAIAYVGVSFLNQVTNARMGVAAVANKGGAYVLPSTATLRAAANEFEAKTPADGRISLLNGAHKESYPIANYEYAIVKRQQSDPAVADALRKFLGWVIAPSGGSKTAILDPVHFVPLPERIRTQSASQIGEIK